MARPLRIEFDGAWYHVMNRGGNHQNIYLADSDYQNFLKLLNDCHQMWGLEIHAYCLMGNHVHFIITPSTEGGLARMFNTVHMRYAQYKNVERRRLGHLWQGRFYSCILSRTHVLRAIRYVEMNPVRAKMVKKPWEYIWSSARQHIKMEKMPIVRTDFHQDCTDTGLNSRNWKKYLLEEDFEMTEEMRIKTQKGLAIGAMNFIVTLEEKMNVILRELKAGRPKIGK